MKLVSALSLTILSAIVQIVNLLITDFHGTLAMSAASGAMMGNGFRSSPQAFHFHHSKALRLINDKLSGPKAIEITTIATIVGLCFLSAMQKDDTALRAHVTGLLRLVNLRGGVDTLQDVPSVVGKVKR